ncbi:hypothetical protein BAE40_13045 [Mesorhizobium loti]|nr:hypothetical protein BAE40_13045 [Mesorhizobium loti]
MANRLPSKPGRIALAHLLNDNGRIELKTTIVRFADDQFYFRAFFEQRLLNYLAMNKKVDEAVTIAILCEDWGALALNGPHARDILAARSRARGARPAMKVTRICVCRLNLPLTNPRHLDVGKFHRRTVSLHANLHIRIHDPLHGHQDLH